LTDKKSSEKIDLKETDKSFLTILNLNFMQKYSTYDEQFIKEKGIDELLGIASKLDGSSNTKFIL